MNIEKQSYINLHTAVFLFGFTAILGALIDLPSASLVWWRVLITCISILMFFKIIPTIKKLPFKRVMTFMGIGLLVGIHWLTFYGTIKIASASVALVSISTASFFTAIFEPILTGKKIQILELGIGALMIPGMIIIFNDADTHLINGFMLGIVSAIFASLFSVLNKINIDHADNYTITFLELGSATIGIGIYLLIKHWLGDDFRFMPPTLLDWGYILVLALVCTTLAYVLSLKAMEYLSAFDTNLAINLEPIYGMILAAVILKEHKNLNTSFYIGSAIIVLSVFLYPFLKKRLKK